MKNVDLTLIEDGVPAGTTLEEAAATVGVSPADLQTELERPERADLKAYLLAQAALPKAPKPEPAAKAAEPPAPRQNNDPLEDVVDGLRHVPNGTSLDHALQFVLASHRKDEIVAALEGDPRWTDVAKRFGIEPAPIPAPDPQPQTRHAATTAGNGGGRPGLPGRFGVTLPGGVRLEVPVEGNTLESVMAEARKLLEQAATDAANAAQGDAASSATEHSRGLEIERVKAELAEQAKSADHGRAKEIRELDARLTEAGKEADHRRQVAVMREQAALTENSAQSDHVRTLERDRQLHEFACGQIREQNRPEPLTHRLVLKLAGFAAFGVLILLLVWAGGHFH